MSTTRRDFFAYGGAGVMGAALAAGGVGVGSAPRAALAQAAQNKLNIRIAGRTGTLGVGGLDVEVLARAKKVGLEGVEIEAGSPGDTLGCWDKDLQKRFLEEAEKTGIAVASVCMGLCNSNPVFSDPRAKSWLEGTIDATKALGAKAILVAFFGNGDLRIKGQSRPRPDDAAKTIEIMKSVAERAEKAGVVLGLENTLPAEANVEIVDAIGSPAVRVYYDIGNSSNYGYDVPKEIRLLGTKYICQIHFKDTSRGGALLGQGDLKMAPIAKAVCDIGYEGWIVLETGRPLGAEASAAYNTGFIRGLFCG